MFDSPRALHARVSTILQSRWFNLWCACAALFITSFSIRIADYDIFARVALGRLIVRDGALPVKDIFSYSPTKERWIDHEWLSALLFYATSSLGGDHALFLLTIAIGFLTLALVAKAQANLSPGSTVAPLLLFLAVFPSSFMWNSIVRCHALSLLYLAYLLFVVTHYRRAPSIGLAASIPLAMVIWVNSHGGFIVGYGLLVPAAFALFRERAQGAGAFVVAVATSLIAPLTTPWGIEYLSVISHALLMPRPDINEWNGLRVLAPSAILFTLSLVMTAAALLSKGRRAIPFEGRVFLVASAIASLTHQRLIPFFLFAGCVYLPAAIGSLPSAVSPWLRDRIRALGVALGFSAHAVGLAGFLFVALFITSWRGFSLDYTPYPTQVLDWMRQHKLSGNVLVHFNQGSYVLMKGYPQMLVSNDGRYEAVYTKEVSDLAMSALLPHSPHFAEAFARLAPDFIILCAESTPLSIISSFPGTWEPLFIQDNRECGVFGDPSRVHSGGRSVVSEPRWKLHF